MYSSANSFKQVTEKLKHDLQITLKWFESNLLVANPEKFQLMFLGATNTSSEKGSLTIGASTLVPSEKIKLLELLSTNFDSYISNQCISENNKINCFYPIKKY